MKIAILPDGTVRHVYSDSARRLDERLGKPVINRASNVEFNHETGNWEARIPETNELIASGRNREQVIKDEVAVIESRLHLTTV